jgi:hypothetical protein
VEERIKFYFWGMHLSDEGCQNTSDELKQDTTFRWQLTEFKVFINIDSFCIFTNNICSMMKNKIYQEIQQRLNKQSQKITIIVGTGSSLSVDSDFGMWSLENQLKRIIPNLVNNFPKLKKEWAKVLKQLEEGVDFENSLNEIRSEGTLLDIIIRETGNFVTGVNRKHIPALQKGEIEIPISVLFKKLSNILSVHNPTIDVITPNYDLLLEYALRKANVEFTDGFYGNIQKELNWKEASNDFLMPYSIKRKGRASNTPKWNLKPHFRLHKIHGSLNYFWSGDKVYRDDTLTFHENEGINRFIITPGTAKYQRIVETREFYIECDKAIENTDCFLFVGYGFNDNDIDVKIRKQLDKQGKNAIIITKELIGKGTDLLSRYPNIIAIEENTLKNGSCIHYQGKLHNFDENLWEINTFANEIF